MKLLLDRLCTCFLGEWRMVARLAFAERSHATSPTKSQTSPMLTRDEQRHWNSVWQTVLSLHHRPKTQIPQALPRRKRTTPSRTRPSRPLRHPLLRHLITTPSTIRSTRTSTTTSTASRSTTPQMFEHSISARLKASTAGFGTDWTILTPRQIYM